MKYLNPSHVLLLAKKALTSLAFLSLIALSVPQGAFAQVATDTAPTDTVTTTTDTPPDTTVTPPADTTITPDETVTDTSSQTDSTTTDTPPLTRAAEVAVQPICTLVSDTSTMQNSQPSVLVSPIHAAWTAILNGASWIWGENPNGDPVNGSTETFTKTFTLSSIPTSASITIAADNSYSATVNGNAIGSDSGEFNYTSSGQDTISIPAVDLHVGTNTLTVTVTNFPMAGGTMATNPAGLLYTLTVNGSSCTAPPPPPAPFTVVASKVVCDNAADLPKWGTGGHVIDEHTASDYVAAHPGCHLQSGWQFEWGSATTTDAGDAFLGPAGNGYTTFGPTDASGTASVQIPFTDNTEFHLREVLQAGYIPFTFGAHPDNSASTSAEFYCKDDARNYDNFDFIRRAAAGGTYYCVGFNAPSQPVRPTTSTVKVCKVDDSEGHTPLSGWTLMLKGAHVGSVNVAPDGVDHSLPSVPAGSYILTASGKYVYRPGDVTASTSDAAYSLRLPSDSVYGGPYAPWVRENNFPNPNTGWLGIMLNSAFTDWGSVFHPDHVYATSTMLAATSTLNFKILDDVYSDNSGSLDVSVDQGYVGITGEDGCTTFTDVPTGSYTSAELNQDGWTNVSGTGPVTVTATSTQTFTIVNHHATTQPPTKFKVHIFKYLWDGEVSSQVPNDSSAPHFPMVATYSIAGVGTNLDPGDPFVLGDGGGTGGSDGGLLFAANTIPLSAGDTYGTHEVTGGDSVVVANQNSCTAGKYYLKGYQVGTTLPLAHSAAFSTTSPNFPSISQDEYVIVTNVPCPKDDGNPGGGGTATTTTVVVHKEDLAANTTDAVANPGKWFFYNDKTDVFDNSLGSFVNGPAGQPLGDGSAQISASSSAGVILATLGYNGTRFSDVTSLAYSTYRSQGDPALALALQFGFDHDMTDSDTSYQGRLVYEPYFAHTVTTGTWQTWDPMTGTGWWFSKAAWATDSGCSQATPCTWAQIKAKYPNGGVLGSTLFKAGTWSSDFVGNVDAFSIGVTDGSNATTTTYDFEPTTQGPTDNPQVTTFTTTGGGGRSGSSINTFVRQGQVLGASTTTEPTCGPILFSFLRMGRSNPSDQVKVLQAFLNTQLSLNIPISGFFGPMTKSAVEQFQAKYFPDVLTPWVPHGLPNDHSVTGYVYKTTQRKVNLVNCPTLDIPLPKLP